MANTDNERRRQLRSAARRAAGVGARATAAATEASEPELLDRLLEHLHDARWPYAVSTYTSDGLCAAVFANREEAADAAHAPADVLVAHVGVVTTTTGNVGTARRHRDRQHAADRLKRAVSAWQRQHPRDTVWGVVYLNERRGGGDAGFTRVAHTFLPAAAQASSSRFNDETREVDLPVLPAAWCPQLPGTAAGADAPAADSTGALATADAFLVPTVQALNALNRTDTVVAMFGCAGCKFLWFRRVPTQRARSHCNKCRQLYERIPLEKEPSGLGFFHCQHCQHRWTSNPAARDVSQPCYGKGCGKYTLPYKLLPNQLLRDQEQARKGRKSGYQHSCAHCQTFGPGPDGKCPLQGRTGDVASRRCDPSASVASSILSGPSVIQYRPSNIARDVERVRDRFMRPHAQLDFTNL